MPLLAHAGPALAFKWVDPKIALVVSLISVYLLDLLLFPIIPVYMVFMGLDYNQASRAAVPLTHSLFMAAVWSVVAMLVVVLVIHFRNSKKDSESQVSFNRGFRTGAFVGFLVFSHWLVDLIAWPMSVGDPQATGLPLFFDMKQTVGFGVGATWIGGLTFELGLFIAGLAFYISYLIKHKRNRNVQPRTI